MEALAEEMTVWQCISTAERSVMQGFPPPGIEVALQTIPVSFCYARKLLLGSGTTFSKKSGQLIQIEKAALRCVFVFYFLSSKCFTINW